MIEIGRGKFSTVFKICDLKNNNNFVAMKDASSSSENSKKMLAKESKIHCSIPEHKNILKFISYDCVKNIILTEFCESGSLEDEYSKNDGKISAEKTIDYLKGIIDGLMHLHKFGVFHGDIAARNILLNKRSNFEEVKISDFGRSRFKSKFSFMSRSKNYSKHVANYPIRWYNYQLLGGRGKLSKHSDTWAFGVLMWELFTCCLELPYDNVLNVIDSESIRKYLKYGYRLNKPQSMPDSLYLIAVSCWAKDNTYQTSLKQIDQKLIGLLRTNESLLHQVIYKTNLNQTAIIQTRIKDNCEGYDYKIELGAKELVLVKK